MGSIGVRMQRLWALEVLKSKRNPNLDFQNIPNYFLKEKSDYCATMTSAKEFRELKELKRKPDMWGPHVSDWLTVDWVYRAMGLGDRWTEPRGVTWR